MKIRPNFDLREFVPPRLWRTFGASSRWFMDPRVLDLAQFIREYFDAPMTINDWHYGGDFDQRGFRYPNSNVGASLSQHKFGRAIDFNISGLSPNEIRAEMKENESTFMDAGLRALEHGDIATTWVHADIRDTEQDNILIVTP